MAAMLCPSGLPPVATKLVLGVGPGLFAVLLLGAASAVLVIVLSCASRSCHQALLVSAGW